MEIVKIFGKLWKNGKGCGSENTASECCLWIWYIISVLDKSIRHGLDIYFLTSDQLIATLLLTYWLKIWCPQWKRLLALQEATFANTNPTSRCRKQAAQIKPFSKTKVHTIWSTHVEWHCKMFSSLPILLLFIYYIVS